MSNSELIQWLRDHSSGVYRPSAEGADRLERALYLLRQIMHNLPGTCDWLNPDLEREAKMLLSLDKAAEKKTEPSNRANHAVTQAPVRWRSYPLEDTVGNTYGESSPQLEYFDGNKWRPVHKVCLSRASD